MKRSSSQLGFTLFEMLVAFAIFMIAGGTIYSVSRSIAYLAAKNAAVNLTHMQSRSAIHRAVSEIRESVAIPQLIDASGTSLGSSTGPAAGVSYQQVVGTSCIVSADALAGQKTVKIKGYSATLNQTPEIAAGLRLIIPAFFVEDNITAVSLPSGSPPVRTVTLANNLNTPIKLEKPTTNYIAYYTQRSALVVVGEELRHFRDRSKSSYTVVTRNITTPTPFSIETGDNRFVRAAFATQDPRILNRGFKSMNMQIALTIPYRFRLTTYQ